MNNNSQHRRWLVFALIAATVIAIGYSLIPAQLAYVSPPPSSAPPPPPPPSPVPLPHPYDPPYDPSEEEGLDTSSVPPADSGGFWATHTGSVEPGPVGVPGVEPQS